MRSNYHLAALIVIAATSSYASAQTTFLYNGSAGGGSETPQSQNWLYAVTTGSVASSSGGATTFNTTRNALLEGGYSNYDPLTLALENPQFPSLNSSLGFTVGFDVQVNSESHSSNDRAGFDVIVLDQNAMGIELGFWADDVWAQSDSPLFTHGSDVAFNTESSSHAYDLTLDNGTYNLFADGTSILSGPLQNYSAQGVPYTLDSYIFIGDDTTAASASETFSSLSVTVPEPATAGAAVVFFAAVLARRNRRSMTAAR